MKKNVYSLVLSENVIAAVDRLAYERHTNRSNLINQILAEYVSYETPEMRMQNVFDRMQALLGSAFQPLENASPTMLTLRSALSYKYNPTVRYQVELYRMPQVAVGELKVSMRTQSATLSLLVMRFFKLWIEIEKAHHPDSVATVTDGRLVKRFVSETLDSEIVADGISAYVDAFDHALKTFFCYSDRPEIAEANVEKTYADANLLF
ncbi:MAG: hypothetical protein K5753_02390 [Clostridia bacterium]|nr:hypothetical protein [Clostridia bacterium]